jgi:hypothetical protein
MRHSIVCHINTDVWHESDVCLQEINLSFNALIEESIGNVALTFADKKVPPGSSRANSINLSFKQFSRT